MSKVRGVTIPILTDTKQFNQEIKKLTGDAKQLQKSLELEFDNKRFAEAQRLAQQALDKTEKFANSLKDELKKLESEGKVNTDDYQKLQSELLKTESRAVQLKKNLDEINQIKLNHLIDGFKNAGESITKAGQALLPFSAAAGAALGSLAAMGLNTVKYADDLKTMADRVNLSAEALQRWQYIAMQTDVSNEELQAGLVKTQSAFASLSKGESDKATQALQALGISADQAAQGMEANFEQMVLALSSIEDPMIQAAYANDIFGERMGAKLIPMLKSGGAGLQELAEEFKNFNVLTEDQIGSLAKFDNALNNTKYAFTTIKNEVGVAMLPVMESFNQMLNEKIIPTIQKLAAWFTNLSDSQKNTMVTILAVVAALAPALLIIGKLTSGIGSMIGVISKLGGALNMLAAHPIIAVISVIVGLMALLYATNEDFRNSVNDLVKTLMSTLSPILGLLSGIIKTLIESIMPLVQILGNYLAQSLRNLMIVLDPIIRVLTAILIPALSLISPIMKLISLSLIPTMALFSLFGSLMKKVGDYIAGVFSGLPKIIDSVLGFIEDKMNKFIDFINGIIKEINKLGKHIGLTISELDNVKLQIETTGTYSNVQNDVASQTNNLPAQAIQTSTVNNNNNSSVVHNTDYSTKNITIEVVVQNYAEELDYEDIAEKINLKLADLW